MNNDFHTILEFLDRCGPEVSGHAASLLQTRDARRLQRLADGKCEETEVATLCEELRIHPAWIRWVADRVKMARNLPPGAKDRAASSKASN